MRLYAFLFDPDSYDCARAIQLLILFKVTYVTVAAHPIYVNVLTNRWVWSIPDLALCIGWMDAKRFLRPMVAVGSLIWVHKVEGLGSPTVCA